MTYHLPRLSSTNQRPCPPPTGDAEEDSSKPVELFSAKEKEEHRRTGLRFIEGGSSKQIPELLVVTRPLSQLMRNVMYMGGVTFEAKQREEAIQKPENTLGRRKHRILEAANESLENTFFAEINKLLRGDAWEVVPHSRRTIAVQQHIFSLLSRAGCLVHETFRVVHRQMPIKIFRALQHPDEADGLAKTPVCMLDPWSAGFLEHNDHNLSTDKAKHELQFIATMAKLDTCAVEVGHARIRRSVSASSLHTWSQSLSDASADYILREARRRALEVDQCHGLAPLDHHLLQKFLKSKPHTAQEQPEQDQPRTRGGGGAWRAFLHQHRGTGALLDMKAMSEAQQHNLALKTISLDRHTPAQLIHVPVQ